MTEAGPLVHHIILFNFKADVPQEQRERTLAALRSLEELPMVQTYPVVKNGDPQHGSHEWLCAATFVDQAAFEAMDADPTHREVIERDTIPYVQDIDHFHAVY